MTIVDQFCQIVSVRSNENKKAFDLMYQNKLYGSCISILRFELDSMIRVIFLLNENDKVRRELFMNQTLRGEKWNFLNHNGKKQTVTDRDMVIIADSLTGWTQNVYKFGCAFIYQITMRIKR